jgi:hypothetical protein
MTSSAAFPVGVMAEPAPFLSRSMAAKRQV